MKKKAVITGMGVLSPLGIGTEENWQALLAGTVGISGLERLNSQHLPIAIGGEVRNFKPKDFIADRKAIRLTFHNVHLALAAAKLAFEDCGLDLERVDPTRFGAIVGSGGGGFDDGPGFEDLNEPILRSWDEERNRFDSKKFGQLGVPVSYPLFLLKALPNNAFYYISLLYNIQGENDNIVSTYTGGSQAIGDAFRSIRRGLADVIIAGGYDSMLTPNTIFSLDSFGLLSRQADPQRACRPFDRDHDGMVPAEGAGFLVVEELEHARARGARIYAEICGYGNASSAYHMFTADPTGSGLARAMQRALEDARVDAREVEWVCADGTGVPDSDRAEAGALRTVFGAGGDTLPVSALKAQTGHMGSGSAAAETIHAVNALTSGVLPASVNCDNPDSSCPPALVTGSPREQALSTVLSINQGIGGQSTALIVRKI